MPYDVRLARPAVKQLDAVQRRDYARVYQKVKSLGETPRPYDCVKLHDGLYRVRSGAFRVLYAVLDAERLVLIVKVARRSEKTYRCA